MKKIRQLIALLTASMLFASTAYAKETSNLDMKPGIKMEDGTWYTYDEAKQDFYEGQNLTKKAKEFRLKLAKQHGAESLLDKNNYLNPNVLQDENFYKKYHFNKTNDQALNLLFSFMTKEQKHSLRVVHSQEAKGQVEHGNTLTAIQRNWTSKDDDNHYFDIEDGYKNRVASGLGYCVENYNSFWANDTGNSGTAYELSKYWEIKGQPSGSSVELCKKILYYAPDGPDYRPLFGHDTDICYAGKALAHRVNGPSNCNNKTKATKWLNHISKLPDLTSEQSANFKVYVIDITASFKGKLCQDVGFLARYTPPKPPTPSTGYVNLRKSSGNPTITNNNDCYSLQGAEFGVYTNSSATTDSKVGTLTTDANGNTNTLSLNVGTYYIKELTAPKGFALNPEVKSVSITKGQTATVYFTDQPQYDPVGILLGKVDATTNQNKPHGSASLQNAHFTVKFYDGYWDSDPAKSGKRPLRTWVFKTNQNGFCYYRQQDLVSGDPLYVSTDGNAGLPLGTVTIQETKAPEGYIINPEVYVRKITSDGQSESLHTYNQPTIPEQTLDFRLTKVLDNPNSADQVQAIPGAVFEHTKPDGTKERMTTNENGELTFKALTYGTHVVKEISVMDGFQINTNEIRFVVNNDNSIKFETTVDESEGKIQLTVSPEGHVNAVVGDRLVPYTLQVHKQNEKGTKLEGAEFTLYEDEACSKVVGTVVTDAEGLAQFDQLQYGKHYYMKETKAPAGYRIPVDEQGNEIVHHIYGFNNPVVGGVAVKFNEDIVNMNNGNTTHWITGNQKGYTAHMVLINKTMMKLPETGSSMTLILMSASMLLGLFAILYNRKRI